MSGLLLYRLLENRVPSLALQMPFKERRSPFHCFWVNSCHLRPFRQWRECRRSRHYTQADCTSENGQNTKFANKKCSVKMGLLEGVNSHIGQLLGLKLNGCCAVINTAGATIRLTRIGGKENTATSQSDWCHAKGRRWYRAY